MQPLARILAQLDCPFAPSRENIRRELRYILRQPEAARIDENVLLAGLIAWKEIEGGYAKKAAREYAERRLGVKGVWARWDNFVEILGMPDLVLRIEKLSFPIDPNILDGLLD